jgi:AcrR family transcriptional regulator
MARLPRAERRGQILAAAIEVFAEGGFCGVTTKRIAQAAGVSEATIFLHFPTKRALYDAIVEERLQGGPTPDDLVAGLEQAPLRDFLTQLADQLVSRQHRSRPLLRLLLHVALEEHSLARELYHRHLTGPIEAVTRALRRARTRGELQDVDPATAAHLFGAIVAQHVLEREIFSESGGRGGRATIEKYVDIYLRGILPAQGGR